MAFNPTDDSLINFNFTSDFSYNTSRLTDDDSKILNDVNNSTSFGDTIPPNTVVSDAAPGPFDALINAPTAPLWMRCISLSISTFVVICGGLGNLTVLLSFLLERQRLCRSHNINIFVLSVCDLLLCTYVCGMYAYTVVLGYFPYSQRFCKLNSAIGGSLWSASYLAVTALTYSRYLIVKHGASYGVIETVQKTWIRIALYVIMLPLVTFMIAFINTTFITVSTIRVPSNRCIPYNLVNQPLSQVFWLLVLLLVPLGIMVLCSLLVYRKIRTIGKVRTAPLNATRDGAPSSATANSSVQRPIAVEVGKRRQRAIRLMMWLIFSAAIFAIPHVIPLITLALHVLKVVAIDVVFFYQLFQTMSAFVYINNALHPFYYAFAMPEFRISMLRVWRLLACFGQPAAVIHAAQWNGWSLKNLFCPVRNEAALTAGSVTIANAKSGTATMMSNLSNSSGRGKGAHRKVTIGGATASHTMGNISEIRTEETVP